MNELLPASASGTFCLRNVKVVDPSGPYHDLTVDILVRDGVIVKVGERVTRKGSLGRYGIASLRSR
jgi:N-acyl-D-aspartate/D-glutamate deacylase